MSGPDGHEQRTEWAEYSHARDAAQLDMDEQLADEARDFDALLDDIADDIMDTFNKDAAQ